MANNGSKRLKTIDRVHLPTEMVIDIFSRLPVKPLLRFKCISKQFHEFITSPNFIDQHLLRQQKEDARILLASASRSLRNHIDLKAMAINGRWGREFVLHSLSTTLSHLPNDFYSMSHSCDGIFCLYGYNYIHVYKHSTGEFRTLPQTTRSIPLQSYLDGDGMYFEVDLGALRNKLVGIGRDIVTKEYKILRLFGPKFEEFEEGEIFTLNSDPRASWKSIGLVPYKFARSHRPVHVSGAIYWLTDETYHKSEVVIVMFDLHTEKFQVITHPNIFESQPRRCMDLVSLRGCLCLAEQTHDFQLNIWIMEESVIWKMLHSIHLLSSMELGMSFRFCFSIAEREDGTIILICGSKDNLYLYDPKCKTFHHWTIGEGKFMPTTYIESLVPLENSFRVWV